MFLKKKKNTIFNEMVAIHPRGVNYVNTRLLV